MSEKVRYYLEQSFAELDDLFTQGLFTKVSISCSLLPLILPDVLYRFTVLTFQPARIEHHYEKENRL